MSAKPPPVAQRRPYRHSYHGVDLDDPYFWLQDPGYPQVEDTDVLAYLDEENAYFESWYEPHQGLTQTLFEELKGRKPEQDESVPYEKTATAISGALTQAINTEFGYASQPLMTASSGLHYSTKIR